MRTRQKRVATDTWRSLGCRTTPLEHWSKRKPTVEPRWAKQQTKKLRPKPIKINSFMSGPSLSLTPDPLESCEAFVASLWPSRQSCRAASRLQSRRERQTYKSRIWNRLKRKCEKRKRNHPYLLQALKILVVKIKKCRMPRNRKLHSTITLPTTWKHLWPITRRSIKLRSHEQSFCATFRTPCSLCWQISVGL